jgi:site-specific DNA-methyltransferase (adenine-specific)
MLELNKVYNIDCKTGLKDIPDKYFDLAIVDPPYGLKEIAHRKAARTKLVPTTKYHTDLWDQEPPDAEYFKELFRVSKNQIVFGANHFIESMPYNSPCWIVWDKVNGTGHFADAELAWTSFKSATRIFQFMWAGMRQGSNGNGKKMEGNKKLNEKRIHPTQKPVQLYRWVLKNYARPGFKILDTHVGSGSSIIACEEAGLEYMGFEISKNYYKDYLKRMEEERKNMQSMLFNVSLFE